MTLLLALLLAPCRPYLASLHQEQALTEQATYACLELSLRAPAKHLPNLLDLAWGESRFQPHEISSAGAIGIGQVIPKYWCENPACKTAECCDTIGAMLKAYLWHKNRFGKRWKDCYKGKCRRTKTHAVPQNPEAQALPG